MEIATQNIVVALPALRPLMKRWNLRLHAPRMPSLKPTKFSSHGSSSANSAPGPRPYTTFETALDVHDTAKTAEERYLDGRTHDGTDEYPLVSLARTAETTGSVSGRSATEPWEAVQLPRYMK